MNSSTRNLLLLLGAVVIIAIPFLPIWGNAGTDEDGNGIAGGADRPSARRATPDLPALRLDLLKAPSEGLPGNGRNIFAGGAITEPAEDQFAEEETVEEEEEPEDIDSAPVAESVEQAERNSGHIAGYNYLGIVETAEGPVATFAFRGLTFYGRVGDTINETFVIKEITRSFVTIRVVSNDIEQRLRLGAPGAANPGGAQ